jgi:phenylalanyl-tRNA synthetase beta subunit (EC 6.1.1.20)
MLVSYKWLKSYVDIAATPEELAEQFNRTGIEVEGLDRKGDGVKNLVVGHVLSCRPHPNADRLRLCQVDIGEGDPVQIVCGAPNVAAGQKVVVAKPGARLPGIGKLKRAKIRGEVSNGMICSLEELGFESKVVPKIFADGIYVLPDDAPVGKDAAPLLGLDDSILELSLTANRADCMSMIGVAYEVAAIFGKPVKLPEANFIPSDEKASDYIRVKVEAPEENPLYTAKIIKNVKVGPSPLWMQIRLMQAGIRPHNNVVDITNYILLEYGQPLHAFDYDRFGSRKVVVRLAREGETLVTLDGEQRKLSSDHLVITNGTVPVALAGVMGGLDSEVREDTTTVLLESAYFAASAIRKASRDHGLRSEASSRYERGVDPKRVRLAAERAAALLAQYAGGEVLDGIVVADHLKYTEPVVRFDRDRLNARLGTSITDEEISEILRRLQFPFTVKGKEYTVTVPSRRWDISIPEDMYEEIARLYGYDRIPKTLPEGDRTAGGLTLRQRLRRTVRASLESAGLRQAITYSLTSREKYSLFALERREPVSLANPMSEEHAVLRGSLIPHLLDAAAYNRARNNEQIALYEVGSVFLATADGLPEEKEHAAGVLGGLYIEHPWQRASVPADFFTVKGIMEHLFRKLKVGPVRYEQDSVEGLHPGQTARLFLEDKPFGIIGKIHPDLEKRYGIQNLYCFEIDLEPLFKAEPEPIVYEAIPRYPGMTRDLAVTVDKSVPAGVLEQTIASAGGRWLHTVNVFDVYEGDRIPEGKKSVAFSLQFINPNRTLTDEEVSEAMNRIIQELETKHGAALRQ